MLKYASVKSLKSEWNYRLSDKKYNLKDSSGKPAEMFCKMIGENLCQKI